MSPLRGWRIAGQHQFLNGQVNYIAAVIYGINSATLPEKRNSKTYASGYQKTERTALPGRYRYCGNFFGGVSW